MTLSPRAEVSRCFAYWCYVFASLTSLIRPLSLALSRKRRGKVLFESIERYQSGLKIKLVCAPARDLYVPSPLVGEGQGEGCKNP